MQSERWFFHWHSMVFCVPLLLAAPPQLSGVVRGLAKPCDSWLCGCFGVVRLMIARRPEWMRESFFSPKPSAS